MTTIALILLMFINLNAWFIQRNINNLRERINENRNLIVYLIIERAKSEKKREDNLRVLKKENIK